MKKKILKGSYTIEASLLLPMILSIIMILMFLSFYVHDRCILYSIAYTAALRGSEVQSDEEKIFREVEESSNKLLENKLLVTRNVNTDIKISSKDIAVSYQGDFQIPIGTILIKNLRKGNIQINAIGKAKRTDSIQFIRECRVIETIVQK
jgi:hypothetical protein